MRVLMNITSEELRFVGGDQKYYKTLLDINPEYPGTEFAIAEKTSTKARAAVRQLEAVARKSPSVSIRQWLFAESRMVPLFPADLDADVIFSTVLAARPLGKKRPQVWYSQGIAPASYYEHQGLFTVDDVATLYNLVSRKVDLIVVGTEDGTARLLELCPSLDCPVETIPQVTFFEVDTEPADKLLEERARFLFVGQDYLRKGLPETLEAYRRVRRGDSSSMLDVVTSPGCPLRKDYTDLEDVIWHERPSDPELRELYRECNILVTPTHADTYNLVMIEGMAFGLAVITSDLPPLVELAPPGEVGSAVAPGDISGLSDAMESLIQDRELRMSYMVNSFKRYGKDHSPHVVMPRLLDAFKRVAL